MSTFIPCRGCAAQIHETAPTCPKCGAPQIAPSAAAVVSAGTPLAAPNRYAQVKWFRRRWFLILCMLTISPIAGLVALTGDMHYAVKGATKVFPKNFRWAVLLLSASYVLTLFTPVGSSEQVMYFGAAILLSLVMGFKR